MKGQFIKAKSINDVAEIIDNVPQPTAKETESIIPYDKIPVRISINTENYKVWEKLLCKLEDKFR